MAKHKSVERPDVGVGWSGTACRDLGCGAERGARAQACIHSSQARSDARAPHRGERNTHIIDILVLKGDVGAVKVLFVRARHLELGVETERLDGFSPTAIPAHLSVERERGRHPKTRGPHQRTMALVVVAQHS